MKRKIIIIGIIFAICITIFIIIYCITKPHTLGNMNYVCKQSTSNVSDFTFDGGSGDKLKLSFSSNIENGSLDIALYDSNGNIVYELDKARELVTFFTLEKSDTYTLVAEYSDFIGNFKIKVTK